jgi:hypothetical protein
MPWQTFWSFISPQRPPVPITKNTSWPRNAIDSFTDRAKPLTALVTANRAWQPYFGVGIVKTVDDFGSQGELPRTPNFSIGKPSNSWRAAGM